MKTDQIQGLLNVPGIYKIISLHNSLYYIGSSIKVRIRIRTHLSTLKSNTHRSKYLQNVFNKYGKDNLSFEILEYCSRDQLIEREQYYFNLLKPVYNTNINAEGRGDTPLSEEHKQNISKSMLTNINGCSNRGKSKDNGRINYKVPQEVRDKISNTLTGRKRPNQQPTRQTPVIQLSRKGEIIKEFKSIKIASDETGINRTGINLCCQGKKASAGSFKWKYAIQIA